MSRNSQQVAQLVQSLYRATRGKLGMRWAVALLVLVVAYLVAQPWLESRLGVNLPGLADLDPDASPTEPAPPKSDTPPPSTRSKTPPRDSVVDADALTVLRDVGRGVYQSPAGLRYTPSRREHRLAHVMAHARDQPNRVGQHGVFDADSLKQVVLLVDEAYEKAEAGGAMRTKREEGRTVYTVNLGRRIGYIGGQSGNRRGRPAATHLQLVLAEDRVITAYPITP